MANRLITGTMRDQYQRSEGQMLVATWPGCRALTVRPSPAQRRASSRVYSTLASLELA